MISFLKKKILSILKWKNKALFLNFNISISESSKIIIGKNSKITSSLTLKDKSELIVGSNVIISRDSSVSLETDGTELTIMDNVSIGSRCVISASAGRKLSIGKNTTFYGNSIISGEIIIGDDCLFAPNVTVLSGTHYIDSRVKIRELDLVYFLENGKPFSKPIIIGCDCWLGVNSVIMPGVTLGNGCVVGANSVVTKSFPAYSIVGGVPAILIKYR